MAYDENSLASAEIGEKGKMYHPSIGMASMTIPVLKAWKKWGDVTTHFINTVGMPTLPVIGARADTIGTGTVDDTVTLQCRVVGKFAFMGPKGNA